jgi:hypothetical protein
MSFAVTVPAADPADAGEIAAAPFWPSIDPEKMRESHRIDTTVAAPRLLDALVEAMATVNAELSAWRATQIAAGRATLAAVPAEQINEESIHAHRYRRAVGCMAKALLLERYRDYDTTARGDRKADVMVDPIDDLRRDARWAINDIQGRGRSTVELI